MSTPRWVKVFGIIAIIAVLALAVLLIAGGNHSPARHTSLVAELDVAA